MYNHKHRLILKGTTKINYVYRCAICDRMFTFEKLIVRKMLILGGHTGVTYAKVWAEINPFGYETAKYMQGRLDANYIYYDILKQNLKGKEV